MIPNQPLHQPGIIHLHLFDQHQIWIDKAGREHEIEMMDKAYIGNVILMLQSCAITLYGKILLYKALGAMEDIIAEGEHGDNMLDAKYMLDPLAEDEEKASQLAESLQARWTAGEGRDLTEREREIALNASAWLLSTPLLRALYRRWGSEEVAWTPH